MPVSTRWASCAGPWNPGAGAAAPPGASDDAGANKAKWARKMAGPLSGRARDGAVANGGADRTPSLAGLADGTMRFGFDSGIGPSAGLDMRGGRIVGAMGGGEGGGDGGKQDAIAAAKSCGVLSCRVTSSMADWRQAAVRPTGLGAGAGAFWRNNACGETSTGLRRLST